MALSSIFPLFNFIKPAIFRKMTQLSLSDVLHIASLSQLEIQDSMLQKNLDQLNDIFALVAQMRTIDTSGIEPLNYPVALFLDETALRLRDDQVTEVDSHVQYQAVAPAVKDGLYLVPKVVE